MADRTHPIEAEATLTLRDLHFLSQLEWFRQLQVFDPGQHTADSLRTIGRYLRQLAAECEGYLPLAEIAEGKARERGKRMMAQMQEANAQMRAAMGFPPAKPIGIKSTAEIKHDIKTESAGVLSMVTDEDTEK